LPFIVRMTEINVDGKPATNVTELLLGRVAHSYEPIFNSHFAMSCSPVLHVTPLTSVPMARTE
jgi:hypothetical protein